MYISRARLSLPPRGAWIEILPTICAANTTTSLPPRGAWIEISLGGGGKKLLAGRSPHGERGLKCQLGAYHRGRTRSLPPRGAWIEITRHPRKTSLRKSRSPHGERGLKYHRIDATIHKSALIKVALSRERSVERRCY